MSPVDKPFWARDALSDLKSAPQTLSSWDSCMAKSYCKYGSLCIFFFLLVCVSRC